MIEPVLVAPETRIAAAAQQASLDISGFVLIDTRYSHWLGIQLVEVANANHRTTISSAIPVLVISTDAERTIAEQARETLKLTGVYYGQSENRNTIRST